MPRRYYNSVAVYSTETRKIFHDSWLFCCLVDELKTSTSYIRKKIYGIDLVIQRSDEKIYAQLNNCPHKMHPVRIDHTGNGPIVCPYHNWSFLPSGQIKKIPFNDECYLFDHTKLSKISLSMFAVEIVGKMVFVNLSKMPTPIEKSFPKNLLVTLADISNSFQDFQISHHRRKFNWKLAIENLRDGLHPLFLHQKTLNTTVSVGLPGIPKLVPDFLLKERHASFGGPDVAVSGTYIDRYAEKFKPWPANARYHNYHLFPNTHITIPDGGFSAVIENYIPIGPGETECKVYVALFENELSKEEKANLFANLLDNAADVYEEDFSTLESIQDSLPKHNTIKPIPGAYERMQHRFYVIYKRKMNNLFERGLNFLFSLAMLPTFLMALISSKKR